MGKILAWFIKYKTGAKVGGSVGLGATTLWMAAYLHGDMTVAIAHAETRAKELTIQLNHNTNIQTDLKIQALTNGQSAIVEAIKALETRIYNHSVQHSKTQ